MTVPALTAGDRVAALVAIGLGTIARGAWARPKVTMQVMSDPRGDPPFQPPPGATCLAEESCTYLLDGIVYRPRAPWTPAVHALLHHLESVGYRGSSRLVDAGIDAAGRQQLRYIDGEFVHPYAWSERGIIEVARL